MKLDSRLKSIAAAFLALVMLAQPFGANPARADEQYDKTNTLLALNMAIVSVKNIVTTQDRVILDQEYNTIINRLSVGDIESDYELVNVYKDLMDVITQNKLSDEEAKRFAAKYDRRQKNAIVGALAGIRPYGGNMWSFLGSLFTQGVSAYFGYRDAKEQMKEELGDSLWQLEKEKVIRFNDLQKDLLAATWSLLRKYRIDDKYRITQEDLDLLEYGLAETDKEKAVKIFRRLERKFAAYPPFWFYYGDAAYKSKNAKKALECFDQFDKVWRHVLREDPYKVQIAKYRLTLEPNLTKERVLALLKDIKENSSEREWLDNLFYGAVAFSIGQKDDAVEAVESNILFKTENEISPVIFKSMEADKLNLSTLPKEVAAALENNKQNIDKTVVVQKPEATTLGEPKQETATIGRNEKWNGVLDDDDMNYYLKSTGDFLPQNSGTIYYTIWPQSGNEKLITARRSMRIPKIETIFILYDSTVMGGNKNGVALGKFGMYGKRVGPFYYQFADWNKFIDVQLDVGDGISVGHEHFWFNFGDKSRQKREYKRLIDFQTYLRKKYR